MDASADPVLRLAHAAEPALRIVEIRLDDIHDSERARPLEPAWVAAMAAELESGARLPAVAVRRPEVSESIDRQFVLIFGGHRLAAHRAVGRQKILAEIRDCTRLEGRRDEVKENLIRHELNPLDRAYFLRELKRVHEELYPQTAHGGNRKSRPENGKIKSQTLGLDPKRFTAEAAKLCKLSEATIQAAVAMIDALTPETITLLRGTETARNASELQRIAAEPADRQVAVARLLREGKAQTVAAARIAAGVAPAGDGDPQEALFRSLVSGWARADRKTRKRFLEHASLVEGRAR